MFRWPASPRRVIRRCVVCRPPEATRSLTDPSVAGLHPDEAAANARIQPPLLQYYLHLVRSWAGRHAPLGWGWAWIHLHRRDLTAVLFALEGPKPAQDVPESKSAEPPPLAPRHTRPHPSTRKRKMFGSARIHHQSIHTTHPSSNLRLHRRNSTRFYVESQTAPKFFCTRAQ